MGEEEEKEDEKLGKEKKKRKGNHGAKIRWEWKRKDVKG